MQTRAENTVVLERASFPGGPPTATDPICLDQTTKLLQEHGLATQAELHQLQEHGLAPPQGPRSWDPLEFLAALRAPDPDARSLEVEQLGRALSQAMGQQLALVPFASRLPTPSAFYDLNESLLAECRRMMTPVLYAEESEVIGVGSINPVALRIAAQVIMRTLGERTGTTPIVSRIQLHHDGWMSLCQQQFGI
jgi:hypothetical protein